MVGLNTLLQSCFGTCLPAVVGGSYAYIVPILTIIYSDEMQAIGDNHQVLDQVAICAIGPYHIVFLFSGFQRSKH